MLNKSAFTDKIHKKLLKSELAIAPDISHPNIVRVHDLLKDEEHYYIAMEYAPLGDLYSYFIAKYEREGMNV